MYKVSRVSIFIAFFLVAPLIADDLVIGTNELPRNFNPYFEYNQIEHVLNDLIYDSLVAHVAIHRDPEKAFLPDLASDIVAYFSDETDFDGTFEMRLRGNVRSQRSTTSLSIDELTDTLNGIRAVPRNLYHRRQISMTPDPQRPGVFFLTVGHPRVGGKEASHLYGHLTFPVVRLPRDANQLIDSQGQEHHIDGFGPYKLEEFAAVDNKIILTRFDSHHQARADLAPEERIQDVVVAFVDKYEDLTADFKNGRFDVLLNHVGYMTGDYERDPSPWLNSFTYVGFNRNDKYRGDGQELFRQQEFRKLVWHSMNSDVYSVFTLGRGERLNSLQKLANPDSRGLLTPYGSRSFDDKALKQEVDRFFKNRPHLQNKNIKLKCKSFVPYHCDLANRIHRRLRGIFRNHVNFGNGAVPVAQEPTWNRDVVADKKFDMLIDTFYYGLNAKILSFSFFSKGDSDLNLTGAVVNRRPYVSTKGGREMIVGYDKFLIDVNNRAEVVVIGSFKRFNLLNAAEFEVLREKGAPLLHNIQNWKSRN